MRKEPIMYSPYYPYYDPRYYPGSHYCHIPGSFIEFVTEPPKPPAPPPKPKKVLLTPVEEARIKEERAATERKTKAREALVLIREANPKAGETETSVHGIGWWNEDPARLWTKGEILALNPGTRFLTFWGRIGWLLWGPK